MKFLGNLKKLLTLTGWQQFFSILTKKEKIYFSIFLFLFITSFIFLLVNFYLKNTEITPTKGGEYIEGVLGSPGRINPVYAISSDVDRDLVELIFSGLMKYQDGKIVPDLAKNYKILEDGKVYEVYLKENLFWSDGVPLTIDDVIFTIETIQNPDVKSPLRGAWLEIQTEKILGEDGEGIRFKLKNESSIFLENLTLKIIPKHIWENVSPQNFPLVINNLNPIGSGPYKLKNIFQDKNGKIVSLDLIENPFYYDKKPYISKISFRFFDSKEKLMEALNRNKINGFSLTNIEETKIPKNFNHYSFSLPAYFAVFFNLKNNVFAEKETRIALNYATNKNEILEKVFLNDGQVVDSPILSEIYGLRPPENKYQFDLEKANEILEKAGFVKNADGKREKIIKKEPAFRFKKDLSLGSKGKDVEELQRCLAKDKEIYSEGEITGYFGQKTKEAVIKFQEKYKDEILKPYNIEKGTGEVKEKTREKLNEICFEKKEEKISLSFSLTTANQPILTKMAEILKNQWEKIGAEVEIKIVDNVTIEREIIPQRQFDCFLFGEVLSQIPDPFPFWHSSQKEEFGLNLSNYENKKVDELLEKARKLLNVEERNKNLEEFQELIIQDAPAIFLYNPNYHYFLEKNVKGVKTGLIVDSSKRFSKVNYWYIKTKRVWKPLFK